MKYLGCKQNEYYFFKVNSSFQIHGGNIDEEARRLGLQAENIIDASASIVPFTLSDSFRNYLIQKLKENSFRSYPDRTHKELKKAISFYHSVEPEMILPGNGASELFTWVARDASQYGINGLPSPGFSDYERALKCWNASYKFLPIPLYWPPQSPQAFPLEVSTSVIWITNPHNPTGQLWSRNSIEFLLKKHSLVICDEAFLPLVPNGEKESLIPLVNQNPNLIVIRSLTKLFAIAGLRLGYAISHPSRINNWKELRDPWPLNSLAIDAGIKLMNDTKAMLKWKQKVHMWIRNENSWFDNQFKDIQKIIAHPSVSNFFLLESKSSLLVIREKLAEKNILLRDCRSFKGLGENWLRVSLQTRENNIRIIRELKSQLNR